MEQSSFARIRSLLTHASAAKWCAILAGIGTSVIYVLLLMVLALFADLLIHRGRIPTYAQLSVFEQEEFLRVWKEVSDADRSAAIRQIGFTGFEAPPARAEDRTKHEQYLALIRKDDLPPVPGRMDRDELLKWAAARKIGGDAYFAAMVEHELRWRAYVWLLLRDVVGEGAADTFQPDIPAGGDLPIPAIAVGNVDAHGVLSLIVRQRGSFGGRLLGWTASWNPWMWRPSGAIDANQRYLTGLMVIALTLVVVRVACLLLMHRYAARATLDAVTRLRRSLYLHSSRVGSLGLRGRDGGDAHGLFTRHVEAIHDALYAWLTTAFRYPTLFGLLILTALLGHPLLAITCMIFGLLVWVLGGQLAAALRRQERDAARRAGTRLVLLLESVRMMRLVKSYLMERFNQARVERQLAEYARAHARRYRGESLARPILVLLGWMAAVTLFYLAGRMVLSESVGVSSLVVLLTALAILYIPIRAHFEFRRVLRRGRESAALVYEFLQRKPDVAQFQDAEFLPGMEDRLEFRNVSLREPGGNRMLLEGVNFAVQAGQQVGIIGPDADAKLALVYLLPRFIDPTSGEVRIDNRNLKYVTHDSLRAQIGLVLQHNLIFNDTVTNNIGCGDPSFTSPQIIEAAKLAHAHKFIQNLPYGYETAIGELGHSLKPSEQFRIALARAILRDPSILVIEEPTFPLDDDAKALIDDTLERVTPGRTVIYLPHRVATIRGCDAVFLLNNGVIEATGTHRELLDTNEFYRHLHYLEFNTFAEQTV